MGRLSCSVKYDPDLFLPTERGEFTIHPVPNPHSLTSIIWPYSSGLSFPGTPFCPTSSPTESFLATILHFSRQPSPSSPYPPIMRPNRTQKCENPTLFLTPSPLPLRLFTAGFEAANKSSNWFRIHHISFLFLFRFYFVKTFAKMQLGK